MKARTQLMNVAKCSIKYFLDIDECVVDTCLDQAGLKLRGAVRSAKIVQAYIGHQIADVMSVPFHHKHATA